MKIFEFVSLLKLLIPQGNKKVDLSGSYINSVIQLYFISWNHDYRFSDC